MVSLVDQSMIMILMMIVTYPQNLQDPGDNYTDHHHHRHDHHHDHDHLHHDDRDDGGNYTGG